ncbi:MAG: RagB/SusD family nutrient uptake outer membrane protein [Bacteroidales bacterium]|nr:RagB/SusD family nutrient uptake outer membrane protein [Bacteroidales bacterium]
MKATRNIFIAVLLGVMMSSCETLQLGDAGLSEAPETSGATIETLFATKKDADKVLVTAYANLPYGITSSFDSKMGGNVLECITDHAHSNRTFGSDGPRNLYYTGALGSNISSSYAGSEAYRFASEKDYTAIRYAWIFIENADRIPDATPEEKEKMKAEAKVCIAIAYANMLRHVGGVPILDHSVSTTEEMVYPRNTFAETVDYIVKLCDEAKVHLPWTNADPNNDGRMTAAAALGLKLRVLCFAASPTFNSATPWHPGANEYHCYGNYDAERWKRAKDAADEFMTELAKNGHYAMVQAAEATPKAYRLAYRKGYYERGTTEQIISIRKDYDSDYHDDWIEKGEYVCPTLNWVNKYGWADGSDFPEDFDWENLSAAPFFSPNGSCITGIETRDPRLYENIAVPGDYWYNEILARVHTNHPNYRADGSGFLVMKYILQKESDRENVPPHWSLMRFPEILLNAAEAYNEYDGAPSAQAYEWVNSVRARVGLSPLAEGMTQAQFREALLRERECEFGFEEFRWFDMIRYGLQDDFTKPLYGLYSEGVGGRPESPDSFTYSKYKLPTRSWETSWDTKWYLAPIPVTEVNKGYGMTQNPGW